MTKQTHYRTAAQKIQQNILKLLQDELGVDAVLPEAVLKDFILQVQILYITMPLIHKIMALSHST